MDEEQDINDVFDRMESRTVDDFDTPDEDEVDDVEETEEESAEEDSLSTDPDEDESRPDNPEEDPDEADDSEADEADSDDPDEGEDEDEEVEGDDESEPDESPDEDVEEDDEDSLEVIPDDAIVGQDDDGNPVTLGDMKQQLHDGTLMQSQFTKRMQELAEREKQLDTREEERASLTSELLSREHTRQFLNEHPEALETLLDDPEETRKFAFDPEAFEDFWRQYEIVKDDPELQEALASKRNQEEANEILTERQEVEYVSGLGRDLARAVAMVGEQFEDVDDEEVANYVVGLAGVELDEFKQNAQSNPRSLKEPMSVLERIFVREDERGEYIDPSLIVDRFEILSGRAQDERTEEEREQEEHNEKVKEELEQEEERPPATPENADAPGRNVDELLVDKVKKRGGRLEDFLESSPNLST